MLSGRQREKHLRKLQDVAKLWGKHDLDAVMLCKLDEHNIGLSATDQAEIGHRILEHIRRAPRFVHQAHSQYDRAIEPVLDSKWDRSYLMVWDTQRLSLEGIPRIVYFRNDGYRHYVSVVVRKLAGHGAQLFQSVLLVHAHAPDGKYPLSHAMRRDIITRV